MKRNSMPLLAAYTLALASFVLAACGDDDPDSQASFDVQGGDALMTGVIDEYEFATAP